MQRALAVVVIDPQASGSFANINARVEETRLGMVGALGLRYDVNGHVSLGAAIYAPELGVWNARKLYARVATGDVGDSPAEIVVRHSEDLHSSPTLPARLHTGIATSTGWAARWRSASAASTPRPI